MNMYFTQIAALVASILGILISKALIPYLKSKATDAQWDNIMGWTYAAVNAFESIYGGVGQGAKKKQAVMEFVQKMCEKKGIPIDIGAIDIAVQDAWDSLGLNKAKAGQNK